MSKLIMLLVGLHIWGGLTAQDACAPSACYAGKVLMLDGQAIRYADTGRGPALLLVHGLGGHAGHWAMNIAPLVQLGYRVVAINLPGYGGSTSDSSIAQGTHLSYYASAVQALATHLRLRKATLVGHSMGGQVALLLVANRPRWLSRLVLVAPAGLETFTAQEANLIKGFATPAFYMAQDTAVIRQNYMRNFYSLPASAEALIQERMAMRLCAGYAAYCQAIVHGVWGMLDQPVATALSRIQIPTLIVAGAADALIPNTMLHPALTMEALLQQAKAAMPRAHTVLLPRAGHLLQWEAADALHQAIHSFIHP